jgi:hypothetical protein
MIGSEISSQNIVQDRRVLAALDVSYSTDLTLKTQEGDRVKISFDNQRSQSQTQSQTEFSDGVIVQEISTVAVAASQYSLTVEGDLSEEELEAIRKLASETAPIAQRFFAKSEFDQEDVLNRLQSSLGALEEIELSLEKTVTETFAYQTVSSTPAAVEGQRVGELLPPAEGEGIDPATIRDIPALVSAVVEAEFANQAVKFSNSHTILRSLGDLINFLRDRVGEFTTPLQYAKLIDNETLPKVVSGDSPSSSPPPASLEV